MLSKAGSGEAHGQAAGVDMEGGLVETRGGSLGDKCRLPSVPNRSQVAEAVAV